MAAIDVTPIGSAEFQVEIHDGDVTTHRVTVPAGYPEQLGVDDVALNVLVRESFRFLLEREPKESILRQFELSVIERYFPEYSDEIGRRVNAGG
ncbi:MAG: hypothetical protein ACRDUY_16355 [Nitriliruptorales bacterium]